MAVLTCTAPVDVAGVDGGAAGPVQPSVSEDVVERGAGQQQGGVEVDHQQPGGAQQGRGPPAPQHLVWDWCCLCAGLP